MGLSLQEIVRTWRDVAATASRTAKTARLAQCLRAAAPHDVDLAAAFLTGEPPQGRTGIGPAAVYAARGHEPAAAASLALREVNDALLAIAAARGSGSQARRSALLHDLFRRATSGEQEFLAHLLLGELRQGALAGLMADALARAFEVDPSLVRRALMLAGSLTEVARTAAAEGEAGLSRFSLELFRPVQPMLAQTAEGPGDALALLGEAAFDYKLDGARIQVHRAGGAVRIYTRNLNDVTDSLPEVAAAVLALPARELMLDGEVIALRPDGRPLPFQVTMRRFGRKLEVARLSEEIPLRVRFFDLLVLDGETLADHPAAERFRALADTVAPELVIPRIITADAAQAEAFLAGARDSGHEGVIAKSLHAPYEAGARGGSWLKIKPAHTLDLVVLAAEWGHGRRHGRLSNLHLGARDPAGGFVMLGKTFKGLTDAMLAWQTRELLAREVARDSYTVHVRPELVVEVAFNDVQSSPRYPGGLALRFARVKAYRPDKRAHQADTIDTVRAIHARQVTADASSV